MTIYPVTRWLWVLAACFCVNMARGQFYTGYSRMTGGSQAEEVTDLQVVNGEAYLLAYTRSANFPSTNGSTFRGNQDITLTKYSSDGAVAYATYIGGLGNDFVTSMKIVNNEVYLGIYTDSINFPVTNGSQFRGRRDVVITKLNSTGNIAFATYLGGSGNETAAFGGMEISNGRILFAGTTASPDFPVTDGSIYQGGVSDAFAVIMNATDGSLVSSTLFGGNKNDFVSQVAFDNNNMYILAATQSPDIPATTGSGPGDTLENVYVKCLSQANLSIIYGRYLGGTKRDFIIKAVAAGGILHLAGYTGSADFPVTNGTSFSAQPNDTEDGYYTRLGPNGQVLFSTFISTDGRDNPVNMIVSNGNAYLGGISYSNSNTQLFALAARIDANGTISFIRRYPIGTNSNNPVRPSIAVVNDELLLSGLTMTAEYPVTNQSRFFSGGTGFLSRINQNGNIFQSTYLGSMSNILPLVTTNDLVYIAGQTSQLNDPSTNGTTLSGGSDQVLMVMTPDGSRIFSGYFGGSGNETPAQIRVDGQSCFVAGKTLSANFPVSVVEPNRGNGDLYMTKLLSCPSGYRISPDSVSPGTQTVCKQGLGVIITGIDITVPGDSLPKLYRSGTPFLQQAIAANYQWQSAPTVSGPWTDIPGAIFRDYTPSLSNGNLYFRRASFTPAFCGSSIIHYSDIASAEASNLTAPVVNAGGSFITCPGYPVTIGGNPTASGGNPPYISYEWDQGADSVSNPSVSPLQSTIYSVTVTDSLGCRQLGQAVILTYAAAAGPDKGACGGQPALIGTPLIPGVPGLQYNWLPQSSLNNASVPQPLANPQTVTDYILTLEVPVTGGGTCLSKDTVRVTPVAAPLTQNLAGPDRVFCLGSSTMLGAAPESGFNYVWSPGNYLTGNTSSTTTYYAGNQVMPVPNPANINVTAQKSGCSFPDQVVVSTIEARAGRDGCGPRIIGLPDRTPDINETYSWSRISGPGDFTGATNLPQVPVSASIGSPTTYRLTVTYNGQSCSDDVTVPPFCTNCNTQIFVDAQYDCPGYNANGGNVSLYAISSIDNAVFTWTPRVGLSNYTGNVVQLTDNVPRVYTVRASDPNDSSFYCTDNIFVNDPAFIRPVFPAPDTITCSGQPVMIGAPPVAGYTYLWQGSGLSSNLVSNPVATVNNNTSYQVTVTDTGGCVLRDTVIVITQNALVNAGPDKILCSSGVVRLGTPAQTNTSYLWEPQSSPWQNNTNQFSAQPEVFVATDISFFVTATTSAGCTIRDTVLVSINSNPSIPDAPDTSTCLGTAVRIGSPALSGVTYQWSPATGLNSATVAQPLANPNVTTTYTVTATFPGNCAGPVTDQVTVTVKSAAFSMPDINFCPDNGPVFLGINAPPGMLSYAWQPASAVSNASIQNPTTLSPPPKSTAQYTLLVSNPNGCQYRDTILLIPAITPPQAGTDRLICRGEAILLGTASNTTGPGISYSWSPAVNLDDPASPNPLFTGNSGGIFTYIVTKTDSNISCSSKDTVVITVQDLSFSMAGNTIACQNSCIQIGTSPVPGVFYQWSPVSGLSNPQIANPVACVASGTASYMLTASDINGCRASQSVVIGVSPAPAAQIMIPDVTGCAGDSTLQFNPVINPPGPYQYTWSPNDGSLSNISIRDPFVRIAAPGNRQYQLLVTDTVSGCSNTATGNLSVVTCDPLAVIGDFMWFDVNANGLQDAGEPGVSGITVRLYNAAGFLTATAATNPSGFYYFNNIPPGNGYYIEFSIPSGYIFTNRLVGGASSQINSKADANGLTNPFNVTSGASILNMDAGIRTCGGGPVPVTLLSFTAQAQNKAVMLYWQTSAEYRNEYFDVERSADGMEFRAIGRVAGQGTSSLPHSYEWKDMLPLKGMNYYRLRQVDIDGNVSFSRIAAVSFDNPVEVQVNYVEAERAIRIYFSKPQPLTYAILFDAGGHRIAEKRSGNETREMFIQLPALPKGIYTLLLGNKNLYFTKQLFLGR